MTPRENLLPSDMNKILNSYYNSAGHVLPIICPKHTAFIGGEALYYAVSSIALRNSGNIHASKSSFSKACQAIDGEEASKEYSIILYLYLVLHA